jgi:hypothetical protein
VADAARAALIDAVAENLPGDDASVADAREHGWVRRELEARAPGAEKFDDLTLNDRDEAALGSDPGRELRDPSDLVDLPTALAGDATAPTQTYYDLTHDESDDE